MIDDGKRTICNNSAHEPLAQVHLKAIIKNLLWRIPDLTVICPSMSLTTGWDNDKEPCPFIVLP